MRRIITILLLLLLPALACGGELSVFAASSLTDALRETAESYQRQHPGERVQLYFAGSQALASQIEQGAPADLLISANSDAMNHLLASGLVNDPRLLLRNRLAVAIRADLQPRLTTIADLARPGLLLAIGNQQVPVGRYARTLLAHLADDPAYGPELVRGIEGNIVSQENKVKAIVAKLLLGEVDAGIVYQSDLSATTARELTTIPLPDRHNPQASYPVAKVTGSPGQSDRFLNYLFSAEAQQIFAHHGFLPGGAL